MCLHSRNSWVSEFVGLPNLGHVALMDLVRDFLLHPNPVPRKNSRKYNALDRNSVSIRYAFSHTHTDNVHDTHFFLL